ncbi:putative GTP pyrophosphokinase [Sporosarcina luteola]|nr:putative GTP pyrophosphokinase [Sporosarcina luteola]
MVYKFALDEMNTKINILKEEFLHIHDYNPIEHCSSRLKSPESILKKVHRKRIGFSLEAIKNNIKDIAGIRITCPFVSDVFKIGEMIGNQKDVEMVEVKDYITNPKPNGYQSLHLIVKIPVFMSDRVEDVFVELQIRTIAMDFWASLEHRIFYKYDKEIPERIKHDLKEAALAASALDAKMENINKEVVLIKKRNHEYDMAIFENTLNIPQPIIEMLFKDVFESSLAEPPITSK